MNYRRLGRSGLNVSELCMGTMQFGWTADKATAHRILDRSFDAGVNFIDTADVYSRWVEGNPGGVAEQIVGDWLAGGKRRRQEVILATKVRGRMGDGPNDEGLSRQHILAAAQDSLRRLRTDYIDLYQLHFPDESVPIDETLGALTDLVRRGDVRYIGYSNFPAWRVVEGLWTSDRHHLAAFVSSQPHYNLINRREFEEEHAAVCAQFGIGVVPYSPLAGGFLTGKYTRGAAAPEGTRGKTSERIQGYMTRPQAWNVLEELRRIGPVIGRSTSQVALAWLLAAPGITSPIIGPRTLEQLDDNLGAVETALEQEHLEALNRVSRWGE
jgi:aryl-alcohol dehydrogenase-like predicted oxidoreductase